jgi:hypothetical protein
VKSLLVIVVLSVALAPGRLSAQTAVRGHVWLPRTQGATVLSTYIDAQARRAVAMGDFLESAAVARKINLEADRMAMENSVMWVETYFERRKLNRQYRDAERVSYRESQTTISNNLHRRIANKERSGNQTDELNYMLGRLLADATAYNAIFMDTLQVEPNLDLTLTPNQLTHVLLKERSGTTGARPFRATDPQLMDDPWPKVFQRPEFEQVRDRYDAARNAAIAEIKAGALTPQKLEQLQFALKEVQKKFDQVYVWESMKDLIDIKTFVAFKDSGQSFLRAQAAGSLRAFVLDDLASYSQQLLFDGDSLVDLLRHCAQHDLVFADPQADGQSTYSQIYDNLRQIYLSYGPKAPDFNL